MRRDDFLLDRGIAHLNHGSYGACPLPVLEEYQRLQRELERGPTDFLTRTVRWGSRDGRMWEARASLAAFVGARPDDLVFVHNATSGLNAVLRSLRIRPEEEILTTKHEYGAILRTLAFIRSNLVLCEPDELISSIGVRTRAVLVSHITSPTALVLPVEEICAAARRAGVLSIVDGAHVPGHIALDLDSLGADVYAGNCHKWLCAPKGAGFLWARPTHQDWIEPLVISWGYVDDSDFGQRHGWQGTHDPAAYLAVPKAIDVHGTFDLRAAAALADETQERLASMRLRTLPGRPSPLMRAVELPPGDSDQLWRRLYDDFGVEVPVYDWDGRRLMRVSIAPYNERSDVDRLVTALEALL